MQESLDATDANAHRSSLDESRARKSDDRALRKDEGQPREGDSPQPAQKPDQADGDGGAGRNGSSEPQDESDHSGGAAGAVRRHKIAFAIGLVVLLAAIVAGIVWYLNARHYEVTDDAFVDGRPVAISPEVSGNIVTVPVTDNQLVKPGDLLAEIDPRDYQAAVCQARAQVAQGQASVADSRAQLDVQKDQIVQAANQVEQARASLSFARDQDLRAQDLVRKGSGAVQNAQQTSSDLRAKIAADSAAKAALAGGQRQIDVLKAQIANGEARGVPRSNMSEAGASPITRR